jgi:hypothetical protein
MWAARTIDALYAALATAERRKSQGTENNDVSTEH